MKPRASDLRLAPIGHVRSGIIELQKPWVNGLREINGFSPSIVLFWLHRARKPELLIRPRGDKRLPKIGFLATRTPHRPNPIGLSGTSRSVTHILHVRWRDPSTGRIAQFFQRAHRRAGFCAAV